LLIMKGKGLMQEIDFAYDSEISNAI